jgi:hypothetical protein
MVYPNQVIENRNWTDNTGIGILLALGEGDGLYIYNTSLWDNELELGMPSEVVNCEVRVRGAYDTLPAEIPQLLMQFYLAGNLVDSAILVTTNDWEIHALTVSRWDSVVLTASGDDPVAVDFLRAEPYGGSPTKRTLTGVGI